MAKKPPTVKKLKLFDDIMNELTIVQTKFDASPSNSYEGASEKFKVSAVRRKYFELKATVKMFETFFSEEIFIDDEEEGKWDSKGWTKAANIQTVLVRAKKLIPMLDYLSSKMNYHRTTELRKSKPEAKFTMDIENSKGEMVERELALFSFDDDDYDILTDMLDCSVSTIRKHIAAMEKVGIILKVVGGSGGGEKRIPTIYAFGYWRHVKSEKYEGPKFEPFLIKKTSRMLHDFNLR